MVVTETLAAAAVAGAGADGLLALVLRVVVAAVAGLASGRIKAAAVCEERSKRKTTSAQIGQL